MALYDHYDRKRTKIYNWRKRVICKKIAETINSYPIELPILEIGIGKGELQRELEKLFPDKVHGMDHKQSCLDHCKYPINASLPLIPESEAVYGAVCSSHTFEHINSSLLALEAFMAFSRFIKKNGWFFLIVPDYLSWQKDFFDVDYSHNTIFTRRRIEQFAKDSGFKVNIMFTQCGWLQGTTAHILYRLWRLNPLRRIHRRIVRAGYCLNKDIFAVLQKEC